MITKHSQVNKHEACSPVCPAKNASCSSYGKTEKNIQVQFPNDSSATFINVFELLPVSSVTVKYDSYIVLSPDMEKLGTHSPNFNKI